jgi:glycosyltransferase involved in cell wall biosynthesis
MQSIAIVTFADLGRRRNLKTSGIMPAIRLFRDRGILRQVICRMGEGFDFLATVSAVPVPLHYGAAVWSKVRPFGGRLLEERIFDFFATRKLKKADMVFFHPHILAPAAFKKAKQFGAITVGIAVTAHPEFNARLEKEEFERLGLAGHYPRNTVYSELIRRRLADHAHDYLIVFSDFAAKTYIAKGMPPERVFVAYQDFDIERFLVAAEARSDGEKFRVLYVAQTTPLKGLHYLLDAWKKLHLPDAELILVGGYAEIPPQLRRQYDAGIGQDASVRWIGFTKAPEQYYRDASLFVCPSLSEGNPRVALEAMASGLPIITTENARGLVEDGTSGFVVPIRDADAIADKIEFLYRNPERRKEMGEAARQAVLAKKPFGERVFEIYAQIMKDQYEEH